MRLNLAEHRRIYVPDGPYAPIVESQLEYLRDGNTTGSNIPVTAQTLALICDLGSRYRLEEVIYYRDSAGIENVTFYGKQGPDDGFEWEELSAELFSDRIVVDLTEVLGHFEQIRILHTVTAGTANVYELEVWTDDGHVTFGLQGNQTVFSVDTGTDTLVPEPIHIYNPETVAADVYCVVDQETTDAYGLALGATSSGPFYGIYDLGVSVPTDYAWSSGFMGNVSEVSGTLTLVTGTYGVYYTPVIDLDTVEGRRLFWIATLSGTNEIDDPYRADSVSTVGVRFSDTAPTDGGWVSGQLSVDGLWSVVSGTLPFGVYDNNHILNPTYQRYFQVKVELTTTVEGETPILEKVGIESGLKVNVPAQSYADIFAKSQYSDHVPGRSAGVLVWSPEGRNKDQ
jgi:hypothetical protein